MCSPGRASGSREQNCELEEAENSGVDNDLRRQKGSGKASKRPGKEGHFHHMTPASPSNSANTPLIHHSNAQPLDIQKCKTKRPPLETHSKLGSRLTVRITAEAEMNLHSNVEHAH